MLIIGEKIREFRVRDGYSQEKLAELVGVSPQAVSKWENKITMPDITMIPVLAKLFKVTADDLLGLTDEEARKESIRKEYESIAEKAETTVELLRIAQKAVGDFPDEGRYWMWALENALELAQKTEGEAREKYLHDVLSYADTLIALYGDGEEASGAMAGKVLAYILLGEKEKSLAWIKKMERGGKRSQER